MFSVRTIFIFIALFLPMASEALDSLPRNLSQTDQGRALEILGFGSSSKILNNPYPLGGYKGLEIGLTTEFIPLEDLSVLGDGTKDKGEFNYYTLTLGKGIYYNFDTYVYFTPAVQGRDFQNFGAQVRWGFYEFSFFPLSLSTIVYGGAANFSNLVNISTFGGDLVATVTMDNVAIYAGGGTIRAVGKFIGGASGITDDQETREQSRNDVHSVFGINVAFAKVFFAMEVDRYTDTVYSGKLGVRF
ncbi:hypothetical protein [Bdellovibrio bacteriovorus]|nr:hypothetical protein [Bdellovibrio bacteriovorus]